MKKQLIRKFSDLKTILRDGETYDFVLKGEDIQISRVVGTPKPWYINYISSDIEMFLRDSEMLETDIYKAIESQDLFLVIDSSDKVSELFDGRREL